MDFDFRVIFTCVGKMEATYERPRENVKVEEGSTFAFPRDPPYISSILFRRVRTKKLRLNGNPSLASLKVKSEAPTLRVVFFRTFREPPQEEKTKTVMDEDEFEQIMEERPARTEAEIMQWLQSLFLFSLCWSIGGNLDTDSRLKFSDFLKVLAAGTNKQHQRFV